MYSPSYVPAILKRAKFTGNVAGDNTVLAAVPGKRLRVISLSMTVTTAGTVKFESGTADGFITEAMHLEAGIPWTLPPNYDGWFQTVAGELLNMILSGTLAASGVLTYQEVE